MQKGKLNIVLDAFWGSCGKGKVCDWLSDIYGVTDLISGNTPNAGHTVVRGDQKRVAKVFPSGAFFNPEARIWLSGSSGFTRDRFIEEHAELKTHNRQIFISDRAFTVTDEHARYERDSLNHISSTMQGSAAALVDKIMRGQSKLVREIDDVLVEGELLPASEWRRKLLDEIERYNACALYEVAQGWGLSIDHGTHYPNCTSRNCNVQRALDDAACPPKLLGDVYAVVRPYPIRVGNTEGGNSGGWMPDCTEVDWAHVQRISGLSEELSEKERTTVTKRVRRVSTFSFELLKDCCIHNGVTKIFLNFGQYIDASIADKRGRIRNAPKSVRVFIEAIEAATRIPVIAVGTGADTHDVLEV